MKAVISLLLLIATTSMAAISPLMLNVPSEDDTLGIVNYLEETDTKPEFISRAQQFQPRALNRRDSRFSSPLSGIQLEAIVNLAERVWEVIKDNAPVLNVNYKYANALPRGVASSDELENFSNLQYKSYRQYGRNLFGATVYDVTYTLVHRYGGTYNGRGQYLENVTVLPQNVEALWGYTVNLDVENISTVNVGTSNNPIASLTMQLALRVSTVIKKGEYRSLFDLRGDSAEATAINP